MPPALPDARKGTRERRLETRQPVSRSPSASHHGGPRGAPGGAPPTYSFAAKQAPVEWRVVNDFHLDPFLSGRDVSPQDLNALDRVASMLEVADRAPAGRGLHAAGGAALAAATILQLSSEYLAGTRAEVSSWPGVRGPERTIRPFPPSRGAILARSVVRAIPARRTIRPPRLSPPHARSEHARARDSLPGSDATKIHPSKSRQEFSTRVRRRLTSNNLNPNPKPVPPTVSPPSPARTSKTR